MHITKAFAEWQRAEQAAIEAEQAWIKAMSATDAHGRAEAMQLSKIAALRRGEAETLLASARRLLHESSSSARRSRAS